MPVRHDLPLFPLGLVLYPNERLPLHIFEERYKDLAHHCLDHGEPFGIVLFDDGTMAETGSTARIDRIVNRYDDGRMDILVVGEERFQIEQLYEEQSYITADVRMLPDDDAPVDDKLRDRVITQHMKLLELAGRTVRPGLYADVEHLSYVLAQNAGLDAQQKQQLLEKSSENKRIAYLIDHFESLIPRIEQQETVRRRIRSNGHFKDFPPESV